MPSSNSSVTYSTTRGGQSNVDFGTVVLQGLGRDRGLFVPDTIPQVSAQELAEWRKLTFAELMVVIISKFVKDDQVQVVNLRRSRRTVMTLIS